MQSTNALDPTVQEKIEQIFPLAWRRVQQRTGRSWEKKRLRWLDLLGAGLAEVTPNQLRVALNNLVTFAKLPPVDTNLLREAIHDDYRAVQKLAVESLARRA